jgi:hypothetical protein
VDEFIALAIDGGEPNRWAPATTARLGAQQLEATGISLLYPSFDTNLGWKVGSRNISPIICKWIEESSERRRGHAIFLLRTSARVRRPL